MIKWPDLTFPPINLWNAPVIYNARYEVGTNYYAETDKEPCSCCGHSEYDRVHIGKSSIGWTFALHYVPERGLVDISSWSNFLSDKIITDEYGRKISFEEMMKIITDRQGQPFNKRPFHEIGWGEFHVRNSSMFGPNNLLRRKIDHSCVAHGDGTWDMVKGEFS